MQKGIKTNKGTYKYNFTPIFEGIKKIDKNIANENLILFKEICDRNGLTFLLFFGTLLGAVREHDFIAHDEDIDLIMDKKDMSQFLNMLFELRENGFELARYERRGFLSIIRKGEYIDIYFYHPYENDPELTNSCRILWEKMYNEDIAPITFLGHEYMAPRDYETCLELFYGKDWRTPLQYFHYKQSKTERIKQYIIQYLKTLAPVSLVEKMQQKKDQPSIDKYLRRISERKTQNLNSKNL